MSDEKAVWRKSSHSLEGNCVEMAFVADAVLVRDSQDRNGQILAIPVENWTSFLGQLLRSR
ncbi:DUF397 domain-containing protein [Lentzea sp. NPDC006480]|uniref:DUF397 domain-containing protein n=1 Tax=Lentzea sp. NPDC006480 TaxID=3157176 RepID=UPI0033BBCB12